MVTNRAAFVSSRVELASDVSFTVFRVPDECARVSLGGEDFGSLDARVVDTDGLDPTSLLRNETRQANLNVVAPPPKGENIAVRAWGVYLDPE